MKVTIVDVAKKAGVSIATVSNVINEVKDKVSDATRETVLKVIEELNYVPNYAAQRLRSGGFGSVGLVLIRPPKKFFEDPLIGGVASGMIKVAQYRGLSVDVYVTMDGDPAGVLNYFRNSRIDGAVLMGSRINEPILAALEENEFPFVTVAGKTSGKRAAAINGNHRQEVELLIEHLVELGHREIAFVSGTLDVYSGRDRLVGYVVGMQQRELAYREELVVAGDWSEESGYRAGLEMAKQSQITSVICSNDRMAVGLMRGLRESGISIPRDVSVVGIDDIELSSYLNPRLTTIKGWSPYVVGETAVELLSEICLNGEHEMEEVVFEPELIVRESTSVPG